jgi:hypothetical protein
MKNIVYANILLSIAITCASPALARWGTTNITDGKGEQIKVKKGLWG